MKRMLTVILITLFLLCVACAPKNAVLTDGAYTVAVSLTGGSGRASVESPAALVVKDGKLTATVVWSSPYYEWMQIGGVQYDPVQTEGNSAFTIPITLDEELSVTAQTVAMSEPHVIEYALHFDSASVKAAD